MTERRTAAEWEKRCKRGGEMESFIGYEAAIISDLAATEAEVKALREEKDRILDALRVTIEERDDLLAYYQIREGLPDGTWREATQSRKELNAVIARIEARRAAERRKG